MKKYIIIFICLTTIVAQAQNLVPNGNFESFYYDGGSNPIDFYSGTYTGNWWSDLTEASTHHRFDNAMQGLGKLQRLIKFTTASAGTPLIGLIQIYGITQKTEVTVLKLNM
jgi:hypothetical protein